MIKPTLSNLGISQSLEKGSLLVLEHSPLEPIPENLPGFKMSDQRRYGKTLVSFLIFMV
jgi:16S rRNA (guanine966-N2)-methyltransferase